MEDLVDDPLKPADLPIYVDIRKLIYVVDLYAQHHPPPF